MTFLKYAFIYLIVIMTGFGYAILWYRQKLRTLQQPNSWWSVISEIFIRFIFIMTMVYGLRIASQKLGYPVDQLHNSILLLLLFVISYISTTGILVYTAK